jgi:dynein heavy chain, axonemal
MVNIEKACAEHKMQPTAVFKEKIIQLYDTTRVRHGLMLVGPTGGGKTMCYKNLATALSLLAASGEPDFSKVNYCILNPKSITMGQLYGYLDSGSGEWVDGVAALLVNYCAKDQSPEKHWVMFDGPVDALWIESMNTVLDDNKKLCLNSGQIIPLSNRMTMMFEVEDLEVASPATVSRCGMVYMEPGSLGTMPVVKSWMAKKLPEALKKRKTFIPLLEKLIVHYVDPLLAFVRKQCREPVKTVDNNLAGSFMRLMDCFFSKYQPSEVKPNLTEDEMADLEGMLEPLILFALTWSLGATTDSDGQRKFDNKLKELMGREHKFKYPNNDSCYKFMFNRDTKEWVHWTALNSTPFSIDPKLAYAEIIVPTFDSIRYKFVKHLLLTNNKHVLCPGPTGTGKTVNISSLLNQEMPEEYNAIPMMFSAQTSANQTQDTLDEKFEKRRKGVFGPPTGKKFVIFIDDLNMPKKEEYGA